MRRFSQNQQEDKYKDKLPLIFLEAWEQQILFGGAVVYNDHENWPCRTFARVSDAALAWELHSFHARMRQNLVSRIPGFGPGQGEIQKKDKIKIFRKMDNDEFEESDVS